MAKTAKKAAPKKAVKKVATKAAAKPAAPKPIKEVLTKSGLVAHIAEASGVIAKDVRAVLASLESAVASSVHKKGAGSFTLPGLLKITTHPGSAATATTWPLLTMTVIGNDRAGIVREISGALRRHALSIEHLSSKTTDAPMAGGRLFEATVVARIPADADTAAIRTDLEALAAEIQVDLQLN
jgi:predicted amino acid-binding ACT domain protein